MRLSNTRIASALVLATSLGCSSGEVPPSSGPTTHAAASGAPAASGTAAASGAPAASAAPAASDSAGSTGGPMGAAAVVTMYLELGAEGDLSKIKDMVDPKCHKGKIGDVDAVKMMGARMKLSDTESSVESETADTATVKYTVKGDVDAKNAHTDTDIFGQKVEIKAGSMTMSGVKQSGTLTLKKIDGRWVVSC